MLEIRIPTEKEELLISGQTKFGMNFNATWMRCKVLCWQNVSRTNEAYHRELTVGNEILPPPLLFRVGRRNRNLENKWRLRNKITNWQNVYHSFHFLCVLPLFSFSPRHFVACKILVLSLPRLKPITIFCYLTHTTVHHFLPSTLILHAAYYQRLNLGLNWAWSLRLRVVIFRSGARLSKDSVIYRSRTEPHLKFKI